MNLNAATSLTFTLSNPNAGTSLSGIGFTDTLPAGLVVSTPNGLTGSCGGGTIAAAAGSGSVSLSGVTLAASAACNFAVNVSGIATGMQNNTTSVVTSAEAGNGSTASASLNVAGPSQQPPEPTDITPIDLDLAGYYILNQLSGLQADLNNNSVTAGDHIIQQARSFTNTSQRWLLTKLAGGFWKIGNVRNSLCFDSAVSSGVTYVVQNACVGGVTQQWTLTPTSNGYYTISNRSTGLLMDVGTACVAAGACLDQTSLTGTATQSQQWLLRPAYFRGVDNALLEKQEATRASTGLVWWKDAGLQQDVLQILKNHGVNMVRVRPSSVPPYVNVSQAGCTGGACFGETEAQDLDLAKRTKNLGMSLQLSLFFNGSGSGSGTPPSAWATHSMAQLQTDVHDYVKAEILKYRQQGTMPDMVSIGNEVNNGFLTGDGQVMGSNFASTFAPLQIAGMQGVADAAADTSFGPALPAPLTCIHITPQWPMTDFFTRANSAGIPYDVICQSYYPFFHGPLLTTQTPNGQPVEQTVLTAAATALGKPILLLEVGELYENSSNSNGDPWYTPPTTTTQQQFVLDVRNVLKGLPNNLGMGLAYWNPLGVNIPRPGGGFFNGGTNLPDSIFVWNGVTVFDNADSPGTGNTNVADPKYSTPLPALDALGMH